ncbi:LysR family transcriptional regulator [soil metagenome]
MSPTSEMTLFQTIAVRGSLSAAARELDLSLPAVSKRLMALESRLGVRLINRTTRRMTLSGEGQLYLDMANRILADIAAMEETVTAARSVPSGLLRINSARGFGQMHVAPAIADFMRLHDGVQCQLELTDLPINLVENGYDIGIRIGNLPDANLIARRICANELMVCASPDYLARRGVPRKPSDLARHDCIVLRINRDDHATWHLAPRKAGRASARHAVKIKGTLSVNDGQIAVQWAVAGHGLVLRSAYEVAPFLASGQLVRVLADCTSGDFDVYAVYSQRRHVPAKIRAFIDFMARRLA